MYLYHSRKNKHSHLQYFILEELFHPRQLIFLIRLPGQSTTIIFLKFCLLVAPNTTRLSYPLCWNRLWHRAHFLSPYQWKESNFGEELPEQIFWLGMRGSCWCWCWCWCWVVGRLDTTSADKSSNTRLTHFSNFFFQLRVRFSQTFLFPSTLLQTFPCVTLNKYLSSRSFHHHKRTQAHRTQCGETEIERLEGQTVK